VQQFADDLGDDVMAGDDNATPPNKGKSPVDHRMSITPES